MLLRVRSVSSRDGSLQMHINQNRVALTRISATVGRAYQRFDGHFLNNPRVGELFERITRSLYETVLAPGDATIDVGANYGLHTCPMAQVVGPTGRVLAFEPIPAVADSLQQRISHECPAGVVDLQRVALANRTGTADFHCVEADYGYSGLQAKNYPFEPRKKLIKVQVDKLDQRVDGLSGRPVGFIKLDIEGGEFDALRGGEVLLRRDRPLIVFENAKGEAARNYGYTKEDFFAFFGSLDYDLRDILGCPLLPEHWQYVGPWYTVACPREQAGFVAMLQAACVAEQMLGLQW